MKKNNIIFLLLFSFLSCSDTLIIEDLSSLYMSLSDTSSDEVTQNIAAARDNNCHRLEQLSTKKFNTQIRMFSAKAGSEQNPIVRREYYRELDMYKQLYYEKNYDSLKLTDIPLVYRRDSDKLEGISALITFDDNRHIITEEECTISGQCIPSAQSVTLSVNGKPVSEHRFSGSEPRTFSDSLSLGQALTLGENILTLRMTRKKNEYYESAKTIWCLGEKGRDIYAGENSFIVKKTDKTENYHYTMYEIDMSKCPKTSDRYTVTQDDQQLIFTNDATDDKLYMSVISSGKTLRLYENKQNAKNILTLKWYNDGTKIIEYYTGEQNFTDYLILDEEKAVTTNSLTKTLGLNYPVILNRINDWYLLIQYGEHDSQSKLYYFDANMELQTIRKQKIDRYLYKQFGNDELFYEL